MNNGTVEQQNKQIIFKRFHYNKPFSNLIALSEFENIVSVHYNIGKFTYSVTLNKAKINNCFNLQLAIIIIITLNKDKLHSVTFVIFQYIILVGKPKST